MKQVFLLACLLLLAAVPMVMEGIPWAEYVFMAGALFYGLSRIHGLYRGEDFRLKRLNRLSLFSLILVLASAYLIHKGENHSWLVLMLLVALVELLMNLRAAHYQKNKDA